VAVVVLIGADAVAPLADLDNYLEPVAPQVGGHPGGRVVAAFAPDAPDARSTIGITRVEPAPWATLDTDAPDPTWLTGVRLRVVL
jgi:hypothetical protein